MRTMLAVIGLLVCGVASAAQHDLWLDVNLTSKHLYTDYTTDLNQRNFGLGLTYNLKEKTALKVGFYENSFKKLSTYAMADVSTGFWTKYTKIGISGGLVTGYAHTNGQYAQIYNNVQIMVLPHIDVVINNFSVDVGVLPKVLTLQVQYKIRHGK